MSSYIPILAANCFFDSSGSPLSGTLTVTPSSKFRIGGGGQAIGDSISRTITNGSMIGTLQLADPSQTSPAGIGYTFTVTDKAYREETYPNVLIVADLVTGSFDLAALNTGQFVTAVPQTVISISGAQSAGTATPEVFTTGSALVSAYTMVAVQNGVAATASSGNLAQFGAVVGMAVAGAAAQSPLGSPDCGRDHLQRLVLDTGPRLPRQQRRSHSGCALIRVLAGDRRRRHLHRPSPQLAVPHLDPIRSFTHGYSALSRKHQRRHPNGSSSRHLVWRLHRRRNRRARVQRAA